MAVDDEQGSAVAHAEPDAWFSSSPPPGSTQEAPPPGGEAPPTSRPGRPGRTGRPGRPGRRAAIRRLWLTALVVCAVAVVTFFVLTALRAGPSVGPAVPGEVSRGVVDIVSTLGVQGETVAGTGMVLTPDGEILTNNHVIDDATSVEVTYVATGRTYPATVVGTDAAGDVAVLQMAGASGLETISTGQSAAVHVGDSVVAIGNAGGVGGAPRSAGGTVMALDQSIVATDPVGVSEQLSGLIQTSARVEAGDSGGPLADARAQVIAMDTAASNGYSFGTSSSSGYAIPIGYALGVAAKIEAGQASSSIHIGPSAFLGVAVEDASAGPGAFVADVVGGSPAAQIGMSIGDEIRSVDGTPVSSAAGLTNEMRRFHPGDSVQVGWVDHFGEHYTSRVVLVPGPAD